MRELRHRHPGADVRTLALACDEPSAALLDQRVDAVVARLLFPVGGLCVTPLYQEPRVLVIPRGHRLAGKESVTFDRCRRRDGENSGRRPWATGR